MSDHKRRTRNKDEWENRLQEFLDLGFDASRIGRGVIHVKCSECNAMMINGVACHETGCRNEARARRLMRERDQEDADDWVDAAEYEEACDTEARQRDDDDGPDEQYPFAGDANATTQD